MARKRAPAAPPIDPVVTAIAADAARTAGEALVRAGVDRALGKPAARSGKLVRTGTIGGTIVAKMLASLARRSVPGAILVGGALLAKTLSDRRKARRAADHADNGA